MALPFSSTFQSSPVIAGMWRLREWNMTSTQLQAFVEEALALGVTTFDHADIYGDYACEAAFGQVLHKAPQLREKMKLITKCGINLLSNRFPDRQLKHYDTSYEHIVTQAEQSLKCLQTDYLDVLLLHRPDPLLEPTEVARAFDALHTAGKVRYFGVSNFNPLQYETLHKYVQQPLITNQVELSPFCLEHFQNGNMDFFLKEGIRPMAWSPLGGGALMDPQNQSMLRLQIKLSEVAQEMHLDGIDMVALAWIVRHPSKPIPILGTGRIERLKRAVEAVQLSLNREQWFSILTTAQGHEVP